MKTLIIVDGQNDFIPGGALAVPNGDEIVPVINALQGRFDLVVALGTGLVMWGGDMEMAERAQGVMETVAQAVGVIGFLIMLLGVLLALLLRWMWKHIDAHDRAAFIDLRSGKKCTGADIWPD